MNKNYKNEILKLRANGHNYREIQKILGCSIGTIAYHCGETQKEKNKNRRINNKFRNSICNKVWQFSNRKNDFRSKNQIGKLEKRIYRNLYRFNGESNIMMISVDEILTRINNNPHCELTGLPLDVKDTKSWHLDHKLPVSRGGDNSLENLQILSARANQAKSDLTNEEFIELCKLTLQHNGYSVVKTE